MDCMEIQRRYHYVTTDFFILGLCFNDLFYEVNEIVIKSLKMKEELYVNYYKEVNKIFFVAITK